MDYDYTLNNGSGNLCHKGFSRSMGQLHSFDYLSEFPFGK